MLVYAILLVSLYGIVTSSYLGILLYQVHCRYSYRGGLWASHSCPVDAYYMLFGLCIVFTLFMKYCVGLGMSRSNWVVAWEADINWGKVKISYS